MSLFTKKIFYFAVNKRLRKCNEYLERLSNVVKQTIL